MPTKKQPTLTYEQAMTRLQQIVSQIDRGELDIDKLAAAVQEANALVAHCQAQLGKVSEEVQKLLPTQAEGKK